MIKTVEPNMKNECFGRFIPETRELISKMLQKNPDARITPEDALKHPYFLKMGFSNISYNSKVQKYLSVISENIS
jgi:hypothetical protein